VTPPLQHLYRFGDFLFNASNGELTKNGIPLRLQDQPARALKLLIERRGELVTRQELQNLLWPDGVNVDFETGLNSTMRRLRQILLDDAEKPRYVETIPRRGYRFLAAVDAVVLELSVDPEVAVDRKVSRRWVWAAGIGAAGLAVAATWSLNRKPTPRSAVRSSIILPPDQILPRLSGRSIAISPDGTEIAFVSASRKSRQVCRRNLSSGETLLVPDSSEALSPIFTKPDGRLVWASESGLYREHGNGPVSVAKFGLTASIAATRQTLDGSLLYLAPKKLSDGAHGGLTSECMIWRKDASRPELIEIPYGGRGLETLIPQDLLDGRYLLYGSVVGPQARSIWILDLQSGQRKEIISPGMGGRFLPEGRVLYYWAGNLMLADLDLENMALRGQPRIAIPDVAIAGWTGPDADLSSDGTLVFIPSRPYPDWKPVWASMTGKQTPVPVPPGPYMVTDISNDGRFLLLIRRQNNRLGLLSSYDLETGATKELAREVDWRACWAPDRKRVAFSRIGPGDWLPTLHVLNVETGQVEWRLPFNGLGQLAMHWVESTDEIYFTEGFHPKSLIDIYKVKFRDEKSRTLVAGGTGSQTHPRPSPNGRWLAYSDNVGGYKIRIKNLLSPGSNDFRIQGHGIAPAWSADGRELYYRSQRSIRKVEVQETIKGLEITEPVELFSGDFVESTQWDRNIMFDAHRKRFLLSSPEEDIEAPRRIEVITNWLSTLG
jgi:DNA-binding winged helix-turn-helix (wHTH) protein